VVDAIFGTGLDRANNRLLTLRHRVRTARACPGSRSITPSGIDAGYGARDCGVRVRPARTTIHLAHTQARAIDAVGMGTGQLAHRRHGVQICPLAQIGYSAESWKWMGGSGERRAEPPSPRTARRSTHKAARAGRVVGDRSVPRQDRPLRCLTAPASRCARSAWLGHHCQRLQKETAAM